MEFGSGVFAFGALGAASGSVVFGVAGALLGEIFITVFESRGGEALTVGATITS